MAFNLPDNVDPAEARGRWQDAHLNPDQRDFNLADMKFKEVANQVNNGINKVRALVHYCSLRLQYCSLRL